jgi:outer membrane protein TolC
MHPFSLKHATAALLVVWFGNTHTVAQTTMTLSDCIQHAFANSPEIQVAQLVVTDADWQIKESTSLGLPQLSIGGGYQYFIEQPALPAEALGFEAPPGTRIAFQLRNSVNLNGQLNQLLFSNDYLIGLKAARLYRQYADYQLVTAKQNMRNKVTDAYLPPLIVSEYIKNLDKNIANLEGLLADTKAINAAGLNEQLDVDRLQLSLDDLRNERGNLTRQRDNLLNLLKFTIGFPVTESLEVSDNVEKLLADIGEPDMVSEINFMNRPEYLELMKGREVQVLNAERYKKYWMPNLFGYGQYQTSWQGNDKLFWIPSSVVGVTLSVNLWDGGTSRARRERVQIDINELDIRKKQLEQGITLEVNNARNQYENALTVLENKRRNLQLTERIYDTTQKKYQAGVGSSFELVTTEQQLFNAQRDLLQAQYDALTARVAVQKALGQWRY